MKKITLRSFGLLCGIVVVAGFIVEKFQTVEMVKSIEERPLIIRKTWWGFKTEQLDIGSGEWKAVKE